MIPQPAVPGRRHSRLLRRALFALLLIVLGGFTALAWYAYDKGFTRKWRGYITEEFRKQGFEVSLRRLTLDPFRGLVAKEVQIFDAKNRRRTLAVIDEVLIGINYADWVAGKSFLNTLDLRDANLSLPIDPSNARGERLEITKLNARLFLPAPQQIYLARAEAEIAGIRVYAAGRVINPQAFQPRHGPSGASATQIAEKVVNELKELKFENERPLLAIQFRGDLATPEKLAVDLRLQGGQIRRRDYRFEQLDVAASFQNGMLELQRCDLRDAQGTLQAHASFNPATKQLTFRLRSSLDLPGLLRAFRVLPQLKEWAFYSAPALELNARATLSDPPAFEYRGHLALQKFAYRSVVFEALSADGSWDGRRWSIRDLRLSHRTGEVTGDLMQLPGNFRAHLHSTVSPKLIAPLLSGKAAEWFSHFPFQDSPGFEIDVQDPAPSQEARATNTESETAQP